MKKSIIVAVLLCTVSLQGETWKQLAEKSCRKMQSLNNIRAEEYCREGIIQTLNDIIYVLQGELERDENMPTNGKKKSKSNAGSIRTLIEDLGNAIYKLDQVKETLSVKQLMECIPAGNIEGSIKNKNIEDAIVTINQYYKKNIKHVKLGKRSK